MAFINRLVLCCWSWLTSAHRLKQCELPLQQHCWDRPSQNRQKATEGVITAQTVSQQKRFHHKNTSSPQHLPPATPLFQAKHRSSQIFITED